MLESGQVNHQGHREEGPEKTGLQHTARTTTTSGQEATQDDPMPGSSDDHLRQPTTVTDVIEQTTEMDAEAAILSDHRTDQRSIANGSRRRTFQQKSRRDED